jgi:hypothetical protein
LKVLAQELRRSSKTKSNGTAPTHIRSEVRQKRGRDNVVAEIKKAQNLGLPWEAYRFYLPSGNAILAAIYLRRV